MATTTRRAFLTAATALVATTATGGPAPRQDRTRRRQERTPEVLANLRPGDVLVLGVPASWTPRRARALAAAVARLVPGGGAGPLAVVLTGRTIRDVVD